MENIKNILESNDPWGNDPSFYCFENNDEKDAFEKWFAENAKPYRANTDYKFSPEILSNILPGGCYGNGQYLALTNNFVYIEGVVSPDGAYVNNEYIPHGYNIDNNKVIDFTYRKIVNDTPHFLSQLPSEYYGIEIPYDYILEKRSNEERVTPISLHRPLLFQYWKDKIKSK